MSNRSGTKQHGLHRVKRMQSTSKLRYKMNKAAARPRQAARHAALQDAIAAVPAIEA